MPFFNVKNGGKNIFDQIVSGQKGPRNFEFYKIFGYFLAIFWQCLAIKASFSWAFVIIQLTGVQGKN